MEGIWAVLRQRLDYTAFVPHLVPDIERAALRRRDGSTYYVLKNPRGERGAGLYVRFEPEDLRLVDLMDGKRTTGDILVAHLERYGSFALDRLARVTATLGANGFFGEERAPVYEKLSARRAMRDPLTRLSILLRKLIMWDIARWNNADRVVDVVYRFGGRLAFTRVGGALVVLLAVAGIVVWFRELGTGRHGLATVQGSYALGILALTVLQVLSISVHEAGHALAIRHFGRRVRRLGLMIYYLFPAAYVDSTDMAMATRGQRIVVALAGPIGGATVGAICAFIAAFDGGIIGSIAFQGASLFTFQLALNLVPILELDGYHVLVDLLDAPFLRQRSMAFARTAIVRKLRRRERWSTSEIGLGLFGAVAISTSLLVLVFSLSMWQSRVATAAKELFARGPVGVLGLVLLVLVFVGPLLVALAARLVGAVRSFARLRSARERRARLGSVQERAAVLARVRFFAGLPRPALFAIASHPRTRWATASTWSGPGGCRSSRAMDRSAERSSPARALARWRSSTGGRAAPRSRPSSPACSGRWTAVTSSAGSATVTRSRPGSAPRRTSVPIWPRSRSSAASTHSSSTGSPPGWSPAAFPRARSSFRRETRATAITSSATAGPRCGSPATWSGSWVRGTGLAIWPCCSDTPGAPR